jgi:hypothetical protein
MLTTLPPSYADSLAIMGSSVSWSLKCLSRPVMGPLYPAFTCHWPRFEASVDLQIYHLCRCFSVRALSPLRRSLDLIWTLLFVITYCFEPTDGCQLSRDSVNEQCARSSSGQLDVCLLWQRVTYVLKCRKILHIVDPYIYLSTLLCSLYTVLIDARDM